MTQQKLSESSNCDKIQQIKLWEKKTQKLKLWQQLKTQLATKHKN